MTRAIIDALFVYPIKALRGIAVDRARVTARGFAGDRRWMLVDAEGEFVTQRSLPELATLEVQLDEAGLRISRGDLGEVRVPHEGSDILDVFVHVWGDEVRASSAGPDIDAFFSDGMGRELRLVYMPDGVQRPVDASRAPRGAIVSFADGFPFLVVSRAGIDLASERVGRRIWAEQFRANLILGGVEAHAEDEMRGFEVGGVRFLCVKPCGRCVVITRDPWTGEKSKEPLATLADYRIREGEVCFGQNLIAEGGGEVQVGDPVRVLLPPPSP